jgi:hypothetical protein
LDLIFTNSLGYFVNSGTLSLLSNCDHCLIYARMSISSVKPKCYMRHVWNFSKIDRNKLSEALTSEKWDEVFMNVDALYTKWFECFEEILETHVPNYMIVVRPNDKPWMNSKIRNAIRKRIDCLNSTVEGKTQ